MEILIIICVGIMAALIFSGEDNFNEIIEILKNELISLSEKMNSEY